MKPPLRLNVHREFQSSRGLCIVIYFAENGYGKWLKNRELKGIFMDKTVEYKAKLWRIKGYEVMGVDSRDTECTSLLLKPL